MKHAERYSDLLQALKGESLSSGFSTDGSFTSASAVPSAGPAVGVLQKCAKFQVFIFNVFENYTPKPKSQRKRADFQYNMT